MLAILCANFIWRQLQSGKSPFTIIQRVLTGIIVALGTALFIFYKPETNLFIIILFILLLLFILFLNKIIHAGKLYTSVLQSGLAVLTITLFLNLVFYPDLLKYQSGNEAAFYINKNYPSVAIGRFSTYIPAGEFYLNQHITITNIDAVKKGEFAKPDLLYITEEELKQLEESNVSFELVKEFPHFHITMLKLKFINPKTRESMLQKRYLVKLI
jgi:hypothetical protein